MKKKLKYIRSIKLKSCREKLLYISIKVYLKCNLEIFKTINNYYGSIKTNSLMKILNEIVKQTTIVTRLQP